MTPNVFNILVLLIIIFVWVGGGGGGGGGGGAGGSINGIFQNSRGSRLGSKVCLEHMVD